METMTPTVSNTLIEVLTSTSTIDRDLAAIERYLYRGFAIAGVGIDAEFGDRYSVVVITCPVDGFTPVDQGCRIATGNYGVRWVVMPESSGLYSLCDECSEFLHDIDNGCDACMTDGVPNVNRVTKVMS